MLLIFYENQPKIFFVVYMLEGLNFSYITFMAVSLSGTVFYLLLAPFAPHISEEIWKSLGIPEDRIYYFGKKVDLIQQLLKDGNVKPYLSGGRPESIFELGDFEANCENAALLLWSRYVNKLGVLAGEPEDETWTSK